MLSRSSPKKEATRSGKTGTTDNTFIYENREIKQPNQG